MSWAVIPPRLTRDILLVTDINIQCRHQPKSPTGEDQYGKRPDNNYFMSAKEFNARFRQRETKYHRAQKLDIVKKVVTEYYGVYKTWALERLYRNCWSEGSHTRIILHFYKKRRNIFWKEFF